MPEDEIKKSVRHSIKESEEIEEEYKEEFNNILDSNYTSLDFDDEEVTLSRMQIEGFRAITELDLTFSERSTIIHGKNSQGKSSFIEAIRFNLLGRKDPNALVTEPIHRDYDKLQTDGFWKKNGSTYKIHREMEKSQGFVGYDKPSIVKDPDENGQSASERQTQSEVDEIIGISPLYQKKFNRFNVFSLFSIITGDLRSFYYCDEAVDLIDLLFGITLTNVERVVEEEIEECELEDEEKEAKHKRLEGIQRANRLSNEISNLREDQESIEAEISEKVDDRDELSRLLDNKEEIDEGLSKKIDIKDEISDLQSQREEKQEQFGSVKQEISKLESEAVTEEIAPALQEMQQLVSLPNRCPVCTNEVSPSRQRDFHEEGDCPLCGEDVPKDRFDTVSEVDEEGEVLEQAKRREELEELESQKRTIKGEIEFLNDEIEEKKQRLQELEAKEDDSKFPEYKERKEALEQEIQSLKDQSRKIELQIDANREKLHEVARDIWKWTKIDKERQRKEQRQKALEAFDTIITRERVDARKDLKNRLRKRMESLLSIFTHGTFEIATGVTFEEGDSYKYTIHGTDRSEWKPKLLEQTNAELTLHMLLFHTAILSELEKEEETVPLKLFVIDSPYGNGQDDENAKDITAFLLKLPDILDDYQLIVSMADSNLADKDRLDGAYDLSRVDEYIEVRESE